MTDRCAAINEYFGVRGWCGSSRGSAWSAHRLRFAAYAAIFAGAGPFPWVDVTRHTGVPDIQKAFHDHLARLVSICGFTVASSRPAHRRVISSSAHDQDVCGGQRATASTGAVSQSLDSFIVLYIALMVSVAKTWSDSAVGAPSIMPTDARHRVDPVVVLARVFTPTQRWRGGAAEGSGKDAIDFARKVRSMAAIRRTATRARKPQSRLSGVDTEIPSASKLSFGEAGGESKARQTRGSSRGST